MRMLNPMWEWKMRKKMVLFEDFEGSLAVVAVGIAAIGGNIWARKILNTLVY